MSVTLDGKGNAVCLSENRNVCTLYIIERIIQEEEPAARFPNCNGQP